MPRIKLLLGVKHTCACTHICNYGCTLHISDQTHMYLHDGTPQKLIILETVRSVIIRAVQDTIVSNNIATQRHRTPTQPQRPLRCFRLFLGERRDDEPLSNITVINSQGEGIMSMKAGYSLFIPKISFNKNRKLTGMVWETFMYL